MYLVPTLTQVLHHQGCCLHFRTDGLVPNIWYQGIRGSSTRCRSSSVTTQHSDSVFLKNREEKDIYEVAPHRCREENRPEAESGNSVREPALTQVLKVVHI